MIPEFPEFKKLEFSDKAEVEQFTKDFPPYSDFNFVSMWSWDVRGDMRLSNLNGNLVVKFSHYLTEDTFLSFIGKNKITETAKMLIGASKNTLELPAEIKLVPEFMIEDLRQNDFTIVEEPGQFDYIYDLKVLSEFAGGHFASKRTAMNKLLRNCPTITAKIIDISDEIHKFSIKKVNLAWLRHKTKKDPYDEVKNELIAIDRFLTAPNQDSMITVGVYVDDVMVGYHVAERVQDDFAICHYVKADFSHVGIYDYLMRETARTLLSMGIKYLNFEQDLGLLGLKISKERFSTGIFLKKYKLVII